MGFTGSFTKEVAKRGAPAKKDAKKDAGSGDDKKGAADKQKPKRLLKARAPAGKDAPADKNAGKDAPADKNAGKDAPADKKAGKDAPVDKNAKDKAATKKPAAGGKKEAPKKMTNEERQKLKEEMFKPKIVMKQSRKLCSQCEVNDPTRKVPFVTGKFIGCLELRKKSTKQAIRVCDDENVIVVKPTDKPTDILKSISVNDIKVAGNEKDPVKRKAAVNKAVDALTVLKAMRTPAKDQSDVKGRRLAKDDKGSDAKDKGVGSDAKDKGGDAKGSDAKDKGGKDGAADKKRVPEKAGDKRKKGTPMNQSRIMCNLRCAGTCEQRGLRKTSCTCGEGQNGKWCNTNKELKTKKNEYCAAFTDGQKDAHCAKDCDIDTQKEMLK